MDGDRYYIMYDEMARPKTTFQPADYPRVAPLDIGRSVTREDMCEFFIKFMESDQLGRIAVAHRVKADQNDEGVLHQDCLKLSEMHSTAVDFSKTGIPVSMGSQFSLFLVADHWNRTGRYVPTAQRQSLATRL